MYDRPPGTDISERLQRRLPCQSQAHSKYKDITISVKKTKTKRKRVTPTRKSCATCSHSDRQEPNIKTHTAPKIQHSRCRLLHPKKKNGEKKPQNILTTRPTTPSRPILPILPIPVCNSNTHTNTHEPVASDLREATREMSPLTVTEEEICFLFPRNPEHVCRSG